MINVDQIERLSKNKLVKQFSDHLQYKYLGNFE